MSLALYMDVHVPAAITRGLRRSSVEVLTAQEDGTAKLDDPRLINRALALGRILFSRDEDMLAEATRRLRSGEIFATIVYAHQLQVSTKKCGRINGGFTRPDCPRLRRVVSRCLCS